MFALFLTFPLALTELDLLEFQPALPTAHPVRLQWGMFYGEFRVGKNMKFSDSICNVGGMNLTARVMTARSDSLFTLTPLPLHLLKVLVLVPGLEWSIQVPPCSLKSVGFCVWNRG